MATLFLRVNNTEISKAKLRPKIENGAPFGPPEVVIEIPALNNLESLGEITLEENTGMESGLPEFKIEVRHGKREEWCRISQQELVKLLQDKSASSSKK